MAFAGGIWPVMLTPFTMDGAVDWNGVDALTDWYIEGGAAGLFAVAQSSEMYDLSPDERLELARRVVTRAAGQVSVVATGTFGGAIRQQAEFVRAMIETGVQAVVVITSQLAAQDESDAVWLARASELLSLTEDIPLGLYECPAPYKRLLSPEIIGWAAASGRFCFHKDTSTDADAIAAKLRAVAGTDFRFYNAHGPTLSFSLEQGGAGYSGIGANYFPALFTWLCAHVGTPAASAIQDFISRTNEFIHQNYPTAAKFYAQQQGIPITTYCRAQKDTLTAADHEALLRLKAEADTLIGGLAARSGG